MSAVAPLSLPRSSAALPVFGAGGAEPWAAALARPAHLTLVPDDDEDGGQLLDVPRWIAAADEADRTALVGLTGPVLDIGCGPGRMVRAALDNGMQACGLDVAPAAVAYCRRAGLPVLQRNIFDRLPLEGRWNGLLLLDGNVGIGGDVPALLARCHDLLRPGGALIAEAHPDRTRDAAALWRVRDAAGDLSAAFRWSQVGVPALLRAAAGFAAEDVWSAGERWFVRLRRPAA